MDDFEDNDVLHHAIKYESDDDILTLIDAQIDVNTRDLYGRTPLHIALFAREKSATLVKALINAGADVNARDGCCRTPIHYAWINDEVMSDDDFELNYYSNPESIRVLIDNGADVNARDNQERTPLHIAMTLKDDSSVIVDMLVKSGADVNAKDCYGRTPLYDAWIESEDGYFNYNNSKSVLNLINNGAFVNVKDNEGDTPLYKAIRFFDTVSILNLINQGAIDDQHEDNANLIRYALENHPASYGYPTHLKIKFFNENNFDITVKDKKERTILHKVTLNDTDILDYNKTILKLVDIGIDVNAKDTDGNTALHLALLNGRFKKIESLLKIGAKIDIKNNKEKTAFEIAEKIKDKLPVIYMKMMVS